MYGWMCLEGGVVCVRACMCMCMSVCACARACVCLCVCVCVFLCVCLSVCLCLCLCMCLCACQCMCSLGRIVHISQEIVVYGYLPSFSMVFEITRVKFLMETLHRQFCLIVCQNWANVHSMCNLHDDEPSHSFTNPVHPRHSLTLEQSAQIEEVVT